KASVIPGVLLLRNSQYTGNHGLQSTTTAKPTPTLTHPSSRQPQHPSHIPHCPSNLPSHKHCLWRRRQLVLRLPPPRALVVPSFIIFDGINQSYFIGSFFLLSGYFSALTATRRTRWKFLWDKNKRLGIPVVFYTLLAAPLPMRGFGCGKGAGMGRGWWVYWRGLKGVSGPVWYCALLLIFDTIFTITLPSTFANLSKNSSRNPSPNPPNKSNPINQPLVLASIATISATSFLLRLLHPVIQTFTPLNLQLAYPQYILTYAIGLSIAPSDPEHSSPSHQTPLRHFSHHNTPSPVLSPSRYDPRQWRLQSPRRIALRAKPRGV
ncbi:hypothetical protein K432DRAFT_462655, partial [Lepidopterella palustris CBS 459.81]